MTTDVEPTKSTQLSSRPELHDFSDRANLAFAAARFPGKCMSWLDVRWSDGFDLPEMTAYFAEVGYRLEPISTAKNPAGFRLVDLKTGHKEVYSSRQHLADCCATRARLARNTVHRAIHIAEYFKAAKKSTRLHLKKWLKAYCDYDLPELRSVIDQAPQCPEGYVPKDWFRIFQSMTLPGHLRFSFLDELGSRFKAIEAEEHLLVKAESDHPTPLHADTVAAIAPPRQRVRP